MSNILPYPSFKELLEYCLTLLDDSITVKARISSQTHPSQIIDKFSFYDGVEYVEYAAHTIKTIKDVLFLKAFSGSKFYDEVAMIYVGNRSYYIVELKSNHKTNEQIWHVKCSQQY